jgi:hypothetical protein
MSISGSAREIGLPVAVPLTTRQRLRSAVAGMATLSALSSCVVGPNYEAPRISLTAFHSTAPDNQETSGVRPKLDSWWTDFHDSVLTQTIQEAFAQNLDLAASLDRFEQARAAAREAGDPPDFLRSISPGMSVEASVIIRQPPAWSKHMFPRSVATAGSVSPAFRNGRLAADCAVAG